MSLAASSIGGSIEAAKVSSVKLGSSTGEAGGTVMAVDAGMPPQHGPQSIGQEQLCSWCSGGSGARRLFGQQRSSWDGLAAPCSSCALHGATQASDHELVTAASTTSNHARMAREIAGWRRLVEARTGEA